MRIKNIHLRGYKRFEDLTIDLGDQPKRIIALVGPNGCGKSSVLDSMLYAGNRYGQIVGNKGSKDFHYHSLHQESAYNNDGNSVEINFVDGTYHQVRSMRSGQGTTGTMFSFRSPYRYNSHLKIKEAKANKDIAPNDYGATATSDLDDKMEQNYRRLNAKYKNDMEKFDWKPSEAKARIIGDLNNSIQNCLDLEIANLGNIDDDKGTLFFKKPDTNDIFEFDVLSSGEKEVVDILLDLYLRRDVYHDTIFLIDEPELHINTSIQRKLLLEINKLVGAGCQIWIATHSIGFLRALQEELRGECDIICFGEGMKLSSDAYILRPIKKTRSEWSEIFKTALDDLTGLVSPKRIIYCEGQDKPGAGGRERGLDAKVYNAIFSVNYVDTIFVSSGGNTELEQRSAIALAILTKVFPDIEIWVLKDRDFDSGKPVGIAKRRDYLKSHGNNHRLLMRWEIENYLFDSEIIEKYCNVHGKTFECDEYNKVVANISDDDVKGKASQIKAICGLKENYSNEKFKLELAELITPEARVYQELENCIFKRK